jgi:hypothetical protein
MITKMKKNFFDLKKDTVEYFYPEVRLKSGDVVKAVDYSKFKKIAKRSFISLGFVCFLIFSFGAVNSFNKAEENEKQQKSKSTEKHKGKRVENYSASIIDNSGSLGGLSQGSLVLAKSRNKLISSNGQTTVILDVIDDLIDQGKTVIKAGSTFYGKLSSVEGDRLFASIYLLKEESTNQSYQINGELLSVDGSAGVVGRVKSGKIDQALGAATSVFVSGAAAGMVESTSGPWGTVQNKGNLKNGLFNGLSMTAQHAADLYTEDMKDRRDEIYLDAGSNVVVLINDAGSFNEQKTTR